MRVNVRKLYKEAQKIAEGYRVEYDLDIAPCKTKFCGYIDMQDRPCLILYDKQDGKYKMCISKQYDFAANVKKTLNLFVACLLCTKQSSNRLRVTMKEIKSICRKVKKQRYDRCYSSRYIPTKTPRVYTVCCTKCYMAFAIPCDDDRYIHAENYEHAGCGGEFCRIAPAPVPLNTPYEQMKREYYDSVIPSKALGRQRREEE